MIKWIVLGVIAWIVMAIVATIATCLREVRETHREYAADEVAISDTFLMCLAFWWALFPIWIIHFFYYKLTNWMSVLVTRISKRRKWL